MNTLYLSIISNETDYILRHELWISRKDPRDKMLDCVEDEHYDQQECRRNCKVKAVINILPQRFIPKLIIIIIITTISSGSSCVVEV